MFWIDTQYKTPTYIHKGVTGNIFHYEKYNGKIIERPTTIYNIQDYTPLSLKLLFKYPWLMDEYHLQYNKKYLKEFLQELS